MAEQAPFLDRYKWIILGVVGFIVVVVFLIYSTTQEDPTEIVIQPPPATATVTETVTLAPLEIYITGAVMEPETTVILPVGSRVRDAIEAAGGVADDADLSVVNMVGLLQDGQQIHVPSLADEADETPTPTAPLLIDINLASADEFQQLPGVGETTAANIIAYRAENGLFTRVDDLTLVPGIGEATFERFRENVTIGDPIILTLAATLPPSPTATSTHLTPTPSVTATPSSTATLTHTATVTPTETPSGPLNINTATVEALTQLPGIGTVTAQAIVDYRAENGDFASVDDLLNVPGIGEGRLADIRDLITVGE